VLLTAVERREQCAPLHRVCYGSSARDARRQQRPNTPGEGKRGGGGGSAKGGGGGGRITVVGGQRLGLEGARDRGIYELDESGRGAADGRGAATRQHEKIERVIRI
jgi:hypothetical protein